MKSLHVYSLQIEVQLQAGMEGVKDLHRPCARYGITQGVITVDVLLTNTLLYFVPKIRCIL